MSLQTNPGDAIHEDRSRGIFRVKRRVFTDPAVLEHEWRALFARCWLYAAHESELATPGSFVSRTVGGRPLLLNRDRNGQLHAFFNSCRHRGALVCREERGRARNFTCPYHGWVYGLDGSLMHVPDEEGFPGLNKRERGLVEVKAVDMHGMVFVTQDGSAEPDPALKALPPLLGDRMVLAATDEREIPANWKIFAEGFLEGYHIRSTHPKSFYPLQYDNINVVETFGRNSRVIYPFRRIEKLAELPPEKRCLTGYVTYVYHLFPNALVIVLSSHTSLLVLEPLSIGRTRVFSYMLTHSGAASDQEKTAAAKRDAAFVSDIGLKEDRAVVCAIQRGLDSSANEVFTFGRFESAIVHFHRQLDQALAAA